MILNRITLSSFASVLVCLLAAQRGAAQEINIGTACARGDQDVNQVLRQAVDQTWLNEHHLPFVLEHVQFDEFAGWTYLGGFDTFHTDPETPFHKYVLSTLLLHPNSSIDGQDVPVTQSQFSPFFWGYDPGAFYVTQNHNLGDEYFTLSSTRSLQACTDVNVFTGEPRCTDDEPDGWSFWARAWIAPSSYGGREIVRLAETIPGYPTKGGLYSRDYEMIGEPTWVLSDFEMAKPVFYACRAFDNSRGVVRTAALIVHENFHGASDVDHCPENDSVCAYEWSFDMPTEPRIYNGLPTHPVDSYQVDMRYLCDLTEEGADWMPLMVRAVANERFNLRADDNIFQNIVDANGIPTGLAPLACGVPTPTVGTVGSPPGVCLDSAGLGDCDSTLDCGIFETCIDNCCLPFVP